MREASANALAVVTSACRGSPAITCAGSANDATTARSSPSTSPSCCHPVLSRHTACTSSATVVTPSSSTPIRAAPTTIRRSPGAPTSRISGGTRRRRSGDPSADALDTTTRRPCPSSTGSPANSREVDGMSGS
ncbi:MAG: hypothetical protein HOV94_41550 [Saccharothrix sp.]|nr:hypothetical protein [Saccharothrix sp.]